jgi:hypothetical protein
MHLMHGWLASAQTNDHDVRWELGEAFGFVLYDNTYNLIVTHVTLSCSRRRYERYLYVPRRTSRKSIIRDVHPKRTEGARRLRFGSFFWINISTVSLRAACRSGTSSTWSSFFESLCNQESADWSGYYKVLRNSVIRDLGCYWSCGSADILDAGGSVSFTMDVDAPICMQMPFRNVYLTRSRACNGSILQIANRRHGRQLMPCVHAERSICLFVILRHQWVSALCECPTITVVIKPLLWRATGNYSPCPEQDACAFVCPCTYRVERRATLFNMILRLGFPTDQHVRSATWLMGSRLLYRSVLNKQSYQ